MSEEQAQPNRLQRLFQMASPTLQRAGQKGIWLLSSVRVFAPKPVAEPLRRVQRLLERVFPKNS